MFTFKFSFEEDVLAFLFGLATVLATLPEIGQFFSQTSGRPVADGDEHASLP